MMSSQSTVPSVSSESSASASVLIHMASSNMVEEVAKMEVSPSSHPTPSSSSASSSSTTRRAVEANAKTIPVQIGKPPILY